MFKTFLISLISYSFLRWFFLEPSWITTICEISFILSFVMLIINYVMQLKVRKLQKELDGMKE